MGDIDSHLKAFVSTQFNIAMWTVSNPRVTMLQTHHWRLSQKTVLACIKGFMSTAARASASDSEPAC